MHVKNVCRTIHKNHVTVTRMCSDDQIVIAHDEDDNYFTLSSIIDGLNETLQRKRNKRLNFQTCAAAVVTWTSSSMMNYYAFTADGSFCAVNARRRRRRRRRCIHYKCKLFIVFRPISFFVFVTLFLAPVLQFSLFSAHTAPSPFLISTVHIFMQPVAGRQLK